MFKKLLIISTFSIGVFVSTLFPPVATLAADSEIKDKATVEQVNINQQLGEFITSLTGTLQGQDEETQTHTLKELSKKLDELFVIAKDGDTTAENVNVAQTENNNESFVFDVPDNNELSKVYQYDENTKEYKQLTHEEAMAHNPLHHVNTKRDELILDTIQKEKAGEQDAWLEYRKFAYKQAPYNFEIIDGKPVYNKYYWGLHIETAINAMREALMEGDEEAVKAWENSFKEDLEKFKEAPGQVPYIIGLNHLPTLAKQYGVEQADFKTWKNPRLLWEKEGRMWWENPVFNEHPELLEKSLNAASIYGTDVNNINDKLTK